MDDDLLVAHPHLEGIGTAQTFTAIYPRVFQFSAGVHYCIQLDGPWDGISGSRKVLFPSYDSHPSAKKYADSPSFGIRDGISRIYSHVGD